MCIWKKLDQNFIVRNFFFFLSFMLIYFTMVMKYVLLGYSGNYYITLL